MVENNYYRPQEVADKLNVAIGTVWRWIREGKLEAIKLGPSTYRISPEAFTAFIEARKA